MTLLGPYLLYISKMCLIKTSGLRDNIVIAALKKATSLPLFKMLQTLESFISTISISAQLQSVLVWRGLSSCNRVRRGPVANRF